jgi:hypothetical protein
LVGWELVDDVGTVLFEGASTTNFAEDFFGWSNGTDAECIKNLFWEDVCLSYLEECYTFYIYLVKNPLHNSSIVRTEVHLYFLGEEVKADFVTKEGQTSYRVGSCKDPET